MFEFIGMVTVWLIGAAACYVGPTLTCGIWGRKGDGLATLVLAALISKALLVVYVLASVTYLIVT